MNVSLKFRSCWVVFLGTITMTAAAAAEDPSRAPKQYNVVWRHMPVDDGKNRVFEGLAVSAETGRVFTAEVSSTAGDYLDGQIRLWELDGAGKVIRRTELGERDPTAPTPSFAPTVTAVLTIPGGDRIILGRLMDPEEFVLLRINDREEVIWRKSVDANFNGAWFHRAKIVRDGIAAIGTWRSKAFISVYGFDGNVRWSQSYDLNDPKHKNIEGNTESGLNSFTDVTPLAEDQGLLLVGQYGQANKFGLGQLNVWFGRCDPTGTIKTSRTVEGRHPSIAGPFAHNRYALIHDTGVAEFSEIVLSAIDMELKTLWQKQSKLGQVWVSQPDLTRLDSTRCVAVGLHDDQLRLLDFNLDGEITAEFHDALPAGMTGSPRIAANDGNVYVVANAFFPDGQPVTRGIIYCLKPR